MKIELLAPAGDKDKLKTAFYFGADAVYFAGKKYGLRAFSQNFTDTEMEEFVKYAHELNKKAYITLNIFAHNTDFNELKQYIEFLDKIKVDACIVSDLGILSFIKKIAPNLEIHISTQANITNKYSAMKYVEMGAKRLILARELKLDEIKEIRDFIPSDIELECFVHGAMCVSYSGRCLLSNYLTNRDSNHGECAQPCRWEYAISEKNRKGEYYPIEEDERGTYILNSKDLNMINHLDKLARVGVTSFKIEGRMKSPYYVATIVNAYKRAIEILQNSSEYSCPKILEDELYKASHRGYTTGFYLGENNKQCLESSSATQESEFVAIVLSSTTDGYVLVEQRNKFAIGDTLNILSPSDQFNKDILVTEILDENKKQIEVAQLVQQKLYIKTNLVLKTNDILRKNY